MDIVEKLRMQAASDEAAGTLYSHTVAIEAADTIEKLRKDANRYRWLRDVGNETWVPLGNRCGVKFTHEVDQAIDEEMAKNGVSK